MCKTIKLALVFSLFVPMVFICCNSPYLPISRQEFKLNNFDSSLKAVSLTDSKLVEILDSFINNARVNKYYKGEVTALLKLGNYHFTSSNYFEAMEISERSMEVAQKNSLHKELSSSIFLMGSILAELKSYDKGAQYFFLSLDAAEKSNDPEAIAQSLGGIGIMFSTQNDNDKALEYLKRAYGIAQEISDLELMSQQCNNIAIIFSKLSQYDSAYSYFHKSLSIDQELGNKLPEGITISNIGYIQLKRKLYGDALEKYSKALLLYEALGNKYHIANATLGLSQYYFERDSIERSVYYLKKALEIGVENSYLNIIRLASSGLHQTYLYRKDTASAYQYLTKMVASSDSLAILNNQRLSTKLELEYLLEKEKMQKKLDQQTRNNIFTSIVIVLVLGLVVLVLLLSRIKIKAKHATLEKSVIQHELNFKNKELSINILSLIKKNELLSEISNRLKGIEKETDNKQVKDSILEVNLWIRRNADEKLLKEFSARFHEVHIGFYEVLQANFPELTQNDLKLCAFLRLGLSTKEIGELTNQRIETIEHSRYRLRKKLGIGNTDTNLVVFLSQFGIKLKQE